MNCLNCDTNFNGSFCPNCGQRAGVNRIDFKTFTDSLISGLTDTNKGFLFNLKNLTLKPSETIIGFIEGKRKHVFNPISYLIITVTIYLLASQYFGKAPKAEIPEAYKFLKETSSFKIGQTIGQFIRHYIKFFYILNAIYFGFFTWLFFKKKNLFEHIIINSFIVGHATLVGLLFYPIFKYPIIFNPIIYLTIIVLHVITFKKYTNKFEAIISSVFTIILTLLLQVFLPALGIYIISLF